jgi:hypothetical protein
LSGGRGAADFDRARPAGCVCSTITTASAPRGTGPPVAIDVAVPDKTGRVGAMPQAITSSFSITRTGDASPAEARSAERTAKPSTLERSNGGTSIGATTSFGERAAERVRERAHFARDRARKQRGLETRQRILARQNRQETGPARCCHDLSARRIGHL